MVGLFVCDGLAGWEGFGKTGEEELHRTAGLELYHMVIAGSEIHQRTGAEGGLALKRKTQKGLLGIEEVGQTAGELDREPIEISLRPY